MKEIHKGVTNPRKTLDSSLHGESREGIIDIIMGIIRFVNSGQPTTIVEFPSDEMSNVLFGFSGPFRSNLRTWADCRPPSVAYNISTLSSLITVGNFPMSAITYIVNTTSTVLI